MGKGEVMGGEETSSQSFSSASALSSQYVIPISRYIVVAMVRCSCACSRWPVRRESLPSPRWQWAMSGRMPNPQRPSRLYGH